MKADEDLGCGTVGFRALAVLILVALAFAAVASFSAGKPYTILHLLLDFGLVAALAGFAFKGTTPDKRWMRDVWRFRVSKRKEPESSGEKKPIE